MTAAATVTPDLPMDVALDAIIGRRSEQQDSARCSIVELAGGRPAVLVVVADGMGGAAGGKIASSRACDAFESAFRSGYGVETSARLRRSLEAANESVRAGAAQDRALKGMGCTLIGAVLEPREITWISVGDSLLLCARAGGLERLNEDHSLAAALDQAAERGEISREAALSSPERSVLRSAITGDRIALIDEGRAAIRAGSRILVATDGILTLSYNEISRLACEARTAGSLVKAVTGAVEANMPAHQDNLTVAAVLTSGAGASPGRRSAPLWAKITIGGGILVFAAAVAALAFNVTRDRTSAPVSTQGSSPKASTSQISQGADVGRDLGPTQDRSGIIQLDRKAQPAPKPSQKGLPGQPSPPPKPQQEAPAKASGGEPRLKPSATPPASAPAPHPLGLQEPSAAPKVPPPGPKSGDPIGDKLRELPTAPEKGDQKPKPDN